MNLIALIIFLESNLEEDDCLVFFDLDIANQNVTMRFYDGQGILYEITLGIT